MAHIFGIYLSPSSKIGYALTNLYGIGHSTSLDICQILGINPNCKVGDLTEAELSKISKRIDTYFVTETDLKRDVRANIKRLIDISSYRGLRHSQGLPVRGQRTHTNAKTQRKLSVFKRKSTVVAKRKKK